MPQILTKCNKIAQNSDSTHFLSTRIRHLVIAIEVTWCILYSIRGKDDSQMTEIKMEAAIIFDSHVPNALRRALEYAGDDGTRWG